MLRVQRLITRTSWYDKPLDVKADINNNIVKANAGTNNNMAEAIEKADTNSHMSKTDGNQDINENQHKENSYFFGGNHIDFITGQAHCHAGRIVLTEQEIKLLKILIANRGRPVSRQKILEAGWGYSGDITTRTLDNFMVRLRKYFEKNPRKPVYFKSRRSVGYLFDH
ncbi:MAG: winged helix-turn-helix transcriptional regulator [Desulfamplus sp.]|nr:winged helix-turn-helix transcriptional regulator [Desulfamplus sp.]